MLADIVLSRDMQAALLKEAQATAQQVAAAVLDKWGRLQAELEMAAVVEMVFSGPLVLGHTMLVAVVVELELVLPAALAA